MASAGSGQLQGRVAIVTGGGTGIGRGIALLFAAEGARVVVTGRRKEPLDQTVSDIAAAGGQAQAISADVSSPADCQRVVRETVSRFGALHTLVNNAGMARFGAVDQNSDEDITTMVNVNLLGPMYMTKCAIPELVKSKDSGGASIVNISSSVVDKPVRSFSVYSAAKAGLVHFTKCTALDLAADRVRVNCINPGVVDTPIFGTMMPADRIETAMQEFAKQTPLGRVGAPRDIAEAALYFASPRASWVTGAVLTVDGGISLA
ncbi:MAG TPA: SDR family oxidoreductase [Planctomycetota bacterium]|nr:SDR family oxidoreductase [Planctomycetota bacterium]